MVDAQSDFGCVGDGVVDDTAAMVAFFNHCITYRVDGHIPEGIYRIAWGSLAFDNGHIDKPWPTISTAGFFAVILRGTGDINAPMISISNGVTSTADDKMWRGGALGGFTVEQVGDPLSDGTNRHALRLSGINGTTFGGIVGKDLQGSALHIPSKRHKANQNPPDPTDPTNTNPDPYPVSGCSFESVEAFRCKGRIILNENFHGWNACRVLTVRGAENDEGGIFGLGAGIWIGTLNLGSSMGWAVDDGNQAGATGGAAHNFYLGTAELDDCQFGIRINRLSDYEMRRVRFVHRKNYTTKNTENKFWPKIAIDLAGGANAQSTTNGFIECEHRIDEKTGDEIKADLGLFVNFNSSIAGAAGAVADTIIKQRVTDNVTPPLGIVDSDLYSNAHSSNAVRLTYSERVILDTMRKNIVIARRTSAWSISETGFATDASRIFFNSELSDPVSAFDIDSKSVTGATQANPAVITTSTAHGFSAGDHVSFAGVGGMTNLNSGNYTILTTPTSTTFSIGVNSTGFPAYTSGGTVTGGTSMWTAPYTGFARFNAQIALTGISGQRVQMGIIEYDGSTHTATNLVSDSVHNTAGVQHHRVFGIAPVTGGRKYYLSARQTSGAPVSTTSTLSHAENFFQIEML